MNSREESFLVSYYESTRNRYYTPEEKQRLFSFFARMWDMDGPTVSALGEAVSAVDGYGIRTPQECGCLLLCRTEEDTVAETLTILFSVMNRAKRESWNDLLEWRKEAFARHSQDRDANRSRERARIFIADNALSEALDALDMLSDPESLRYRYTLYETVGDPRSALCSLLCMERIAREGLHVSPTRLDPSFDARVQRLEAQVDPTDRRDLAEQVRCMDVSICETKRAIGFG